MATPIPITVVTGFLGSGKTTLILNLIPQLPKDYKLALLKNEFGDLAVDSQLAASASISGVQELLNGCICCNLVGQLGDALDTLRKDVKPDRIVVETSGSAFPATLALEINRLAKETSNYVLDGVVSVVDVENWQGYEDTSVTARMQAKYTDLIVFNKWELVDERRYDICLDRVGDLDVQVAVVKSSKGVVPADLVFGIDGSLAKSLAVSPAIALAPNPVPEHVHDHDHAHGDGHSLDHQREVEVLSCMLLSLHSTGETVDLEALERFLAMAPKDEVYRIKAVLLASSAPVSSNSQSSLSQNAKGVYLLNWAFGRWTFAASPSSSHQEAFQLPKDGTEPVEGSIVLRMTVITARGESSKWKKRMETEDFSKIGASGKPLQLDIKRHL